MTNPFEYANCRAMFHCEKHKEYWEEVDERWTHKPTFSKDSKGSLVKGTKMPLFPDAAKVEDYIPEGVKHYNKLKDKK